MSGRPADDRTETSAFEAGSPGDYGYLDVSISERGALELDLAIP